MKLVSARSRVQNAASKSSRAKNILCLAIDRLNADFLGAYGNSWVETRAFDALATESILFDSYYGTSLDLRTLYRAFWRGEASSAIKSEADDSETPKSLFRELKERGYRTYVVSDVEAVALHEAIEDDYCDGRFFLDSSETSAPVETLEETRFYRNFEELSRFVAKLEDEKNADGAPWFIWAHFSGWNDAWDFPIDKREYWREDEEDPAPYSGVIPPYWPCVRQETTRRKTRVEEETISDVDYEAGDDRARLAGLDSDDRRLGVVEAYCGGLSVFDETLSGFTQLLKETGVLGKTLFLTTGVRGFSSGAPSALGVPRDGSRKSPFYAEEVRLPLAIRLPDETGATVRLPSLCEPRDVYETIRAWNDFESELASPDFWRLEKIDVSPFAGYWSAEGETVESIKDARKKNEAPFDPLKKDVPGQNLLRLLVDEEGFARDRVLIVANDSASEERALVVKDWFVKETPNRCKDEAFDEFTPAKRLELFVRPDDVYCVNDVADRCVDDAELLARALRPNAN